MLTHRCFNCKIGYQHGNLLPILNYSLQVIQKNESEQMQAYSSRNVTLPHLHCRMRGQCAWDSPCHPEGLTHGRHIGVGASVTVKALEVPMRLDCARDCGESCLSMGKKRLKTTGLTEQKYNHTAKHEAAIFV